jgi:plastocyanin
VIVGTLTLAGLASILGGCGDGGGKSSATKPSASKSSGPASTLNVSANKLFAFERKVYSARAGQVTVKFTNRGPDTHVALIEKSSKCCAQKGSRYIGGSSSASPGESSTGTATLEPGTYFLYCNVDSHWQQGMVSKLVVH